MLAKEYASENEAQTLMSGDSKKRSRRRSRRRISSDNKENMNMMMPRMGSNQLDHCHSFSGESEGGSGTGVVVITRPKGGRRSLCMDLEEVKACRDLGFELEHQHMLQEMPSRLSLSTPTPTLTLDTNTTCSSGGNSPIANWRISSPGMPKLPAFHLFLPSSSNLSTKYICFRWRPTGCQGSPQGLGAGSGTGIHIKTRQRSRLIHKRPSILFSLHLVFLCTSDTRIGGRGEFQEWGLNRV